MATPVSEKEFLDSDDHFINFIGIIFLFLVIVGGVLTYLSSTTNLFTNQEFQVLLMKILLGFITLMIIVLYANFKALDILQDHALTLFKVTIYSIISIIGIGVLAFTGVGVYTGIRSQSLGTIIIFGIGFVFSFGILLLVFWLAKHFIQGRLTLVAKWVRIGTTIVLNEPGMIFVAVVQSIISSIVGLVLVIGFFVYDNVSLSTNQRVALIAVLLLFTYLSFVILYYFDGANIFVAYQRIKNRDPTVRQGFRVAWKQFPSIMLYALISLLVMIIVKPYRWLRRPKKGNTREIEIGSRSKSKGFDSDNLIIMLLAVTFGILISGLLIVAEVLYYYISFFTLPVIVIRRKNAIDAMKESFKLFKERPWDLIFGTFGIGWSNFFVYLFTALISGILGYIYGFFVFGTSGWAILYAILSLIISVWVTRFVLRPLYMSMTTILYVEASEGTAGLKMVPDEMKKEIMQLIGH